MLSPWYLMKEERFRGEIGRLNSPLLSKPVLAVQDKDKLVTEQGPIHDAGVLPGRLKDYGVSFARLKSSFGSLGRFDHDAKLHILHGASHFAYQRRQPVVAGVTLGPQSQGSSCTVNKSVKCFLQGAQL